MASGDKFYIADKVTLDEVNNKIGTTADTGGSETGGTGFAKLNKIINSVLKIGSSNDAQSSSETTGSIFAKLNYLIYQVKTYLSGIYNQVINIVSKIGTTTDTGATATTGSVMGKLNAILNVATLKKKTHQAIYTIPADTYTTIGQVILNVVGQGEFYGLSSTLLKSIKIIVDDSEEIISAASTNESGYIYPMLSMDFTNTTLTSSATFKGYAPLTFNTSLKIITNSSGSKSSAAHDIKMGYALYE